MINLIATDQAAHLGRIIKKDKKNFKVFFVGKNKDKKRFFPDGETYARLPDIENITGRTVILHSGSPKPNDGLIELKMVLQILKEKKISPIEIFFAYFPYGMQDHTDQPGAINFAEDLIKELVNYYNIQKIYTIDAHFWGREWVENYPLENISAVNLLKEKAQKNNSNVVFITPDMGAERRTGIKGVEKKRINSFETQIKEADWLAEMVKGKDMGVIDDLLETGGTLAKIYDECKKNQANKIIALITHGVLKKGIKGIEEKYDGLYLTNTIKQKAANVDISSLITEKLNK